jgi:multiple sugar transport system permease protein
MSSAATRVRNARSQQGNKLAHVVLIVGSLVMVFPFIWEIIMSVSTQTQVTSVPPTFWPGTLHFDNFAEVFAQVPFLSQFGVSVLITVIRVGAQVILCSMAGYAFARLQFPFRNLVFALVLAILMVPPQVFLISQYQIVQGLGLLNTIGGIVAPGLFSAFGAFLMRQFFLGLPDELEEAARLDGANPFQLFWRVMLPLAVPGISALTVIGVLLSWNDLLWPLVVSTYSSGEPLSVGLATLQGQYQTSYPVLMAASLMASAPILVLFLVMQRRVIDGLAFSGMK